MRTTLLLAALWGGIGVAAVRGWVTGWPRRRRDAQLRALLAGVVVPAPRPSVEDAQPVPADGLRTG